MLMDDAAICNSLKSYRKIAGCTMGPVFFFFFFIFFFVYYYLKFDSWLISRGIKTFPLRMKRHNENGLLNLYLFV
jgi:hypothetical protein